MKSQAHVIDSRRRCIALSSSRWSVYSAAVRPNPPRMVTVVVAVLLLVVGLALVFFQPQVMDFVRGIGAIPNDLQRQLVQWMGERLLAWGLLALSPLLLIIGSLVRGL